MAEEGGSDAVVGNGTWIVLGSVETEVVMEVEGGVGDLRDSAGDKGGK